MPASVLIRAATFEVGMLAREAYNTQLRRVDVLALGVRKQAK